MCVPKNKFNEKKKESPSIEQKGLFSFLFDFYKLNYSEFRKILSDTKLYLNKRPNLV